jgi:hypothetical protein
MNKMNKLVAVCDAVIALALLAGVGGHVALGAFAARIVIRDLPRGMAAPTMSTIFSSFDNLIGVMVAVLLAAGLTRMLALKGVASLSDLILSAAAGFLVALGAFEVLWLNRQIVAMFQAGRSLEPGFRALHRLSERCGHLELALAAVILGTQSWSRVVARSA